MPVNKEGFPIPLEYKNVNDYDFIPPAAESFKDPKLFTNVLFKRMSYQYLGKSGQKENFLIAKGIPSTDK